MSCDCGKPKPGPHGNSKPQPPAASLTASAGGSAAGRFTHIAPSGKRTVFSDLLGARAEVVRNGGTVEIA